MNELESVDIIFMSRHPKRISSSEVTASQSWQKIEKVPKIKKSQDILYPYQLSRLPKLSGITKHASTLCTFVSSDRMTFRTLYYACLNFMTILTYKKNIFLFFWFFLCFLREIWLVIRKSHENHVFCSFSPVICHLRNRNWSYFWRKNEIFEKIFFLYVRIVMKSMYV